MHSVFLWKKKICIETFKSTNLQGTNNRYNIFRKNKLWQDVPIKGNITLYEKKKWMKNIIPSVDLVLII